MCLAQRALPSSFLLYISMQLREYGVYITPTVKLPAYMHMVRCS